MGEVRLNHISFEHSLVETLPLNIQFSEPAVTCVSDVAHHLLVSHDKYCGANQGFSQGEYKCCTYYRFRIFRYDDKHYYNHSKQCTHHDDRSEVKDASLVLEEVIDY